MWLKFIGELSYGLPPLRMCDFMDVVSPRGLCGLSVIIQPAAGSGLSVSPSRKSKNSPASAAAATTDANLQKSRMRSLGFRTPPRWQIDALKLIRCQMAQTQSDDSQ